MKVAIISYHRAINYGAVLQVYALMKKITSLGYECQVIDYRCSKLENDYKAKSVKEVIKMLMAGRHVKRKFKEFRTDNLLLSGPYYNFNELLETNEIYTNFICGSDQIWNYAGSGFDKAYFLDFVEDNNMKHSYAASFGFDKIPQEYVDEYKKLLAPFKNISVREKQGADIVKYLLGRNVQTVLDPTLLLTKNDWSYLAVNNIDKKDYILLYVFDITPSIKRFAQTLSEETGCELVCISGGFKRKLDAYYVKDVGPQEFLGLFLNAKYIITNSFHGTAFSINFNKEFFVELLSNSAKVNSRLENVLDLFDLRSKQIINGVNDNIMETVNYQRVNDILELERKKSLEYLKNVLG